MPANGRVFDVAKAARLDDPERLTYLGVADVLDVLDAPAGARVLDYGAGTGFFACAIAHERPDVRVYAFDRQAEMLALMRAKPAFAACADRVGALDAASLAAIAGRCARVLAINVLHELDDEHLDEIRLALAPGGRAIAIDWDASVEREPGPHGPHVYDAPRARAYLESHGFVVRDERRFRYQFALTFTPSGA